MRVQNVGTTNYRKQQNFTALPKGRAPEITELVAEIRAVMESGSKEAASQLMADYRAGAPKADHELNILNFVFLANLKDASAAVRKAKELFGILP